MVEQLPVKELVVGSSPTRGAQFGNEHVNPEEGRYFPPPEGSLGVWRVF